MAASPSTAPRIARTTTCRYGGTMPHMKSAGMVKIVPLASDVEAEPMVCDRFASRIVPRVRNRRNSATVMTAAGIDAETVRPTRRPRYALAAPKTIPRRTPAMTAFNVNSATDGRQPAVTGHREAAI